MSAAPPHARTRWAMRAVRVALVALAAWALRRELAGLDARELWARLRAYEAAHLLLGIAATAASFLMLGLIELLALRYVPAGRAVARRRGMTTGFVSHALSQSIGVALLTGAAVRARAYRAAGLDAGDVARVTAFVTLTITLGLMATAAAAFLASVAPLHVWHLELPVHATGAVLAAAVLAYLAWSVLGRYDTVGAGAWRIARPSPGTALRQLALAATDWIVTGSLLYVLLPAETGIGYATVLRVYLVAQAVGTMSHVPGGAGVFELLVLALLAPVTTPAQRAAVVAALVMFRVLYYLVPLVVAGLVAGVAELRAAPARRLHVA